MESSSTTAQIKSLRNNNTRQISPKMSIYVPQIRSSVSTIMTVCVSCIYVILMYKYINYKHNKSSKSTNLTKKNPQQIEKASFASLWWPIWDTTASTSNISLSPSPLTRDLYTVYFHTVYLCTPSDLCPTLPRICAFLILCSWLSKARMRALQVSRLLEASRACSLLEQAARSLLAPSRIRTSLSICFSTSPSCHRWVK